MCVCGRSAGGYLGGQMDEPHSIFFVLLGQRRGVKQDAGVMRLCGTKMDANGAFFTPRPLLLVVAKAETTGLWEVSGDGFFFLELVRVRS